MPKYKIFAGLGGGFGGAEYIDTFEFDNKTKAFQYAYDYAVDIYELYNGAHGLLTWQDCYNDLYESWNEEPDPDEVDDYYRNEVESWIDYWVEEST